MQMQQPSGPSATAVASRRLTPEHGVPYLRDDDRPITPWGRAHTIVSWGPGLREYVAERGTGFYLLPSCRGRVPPGQRRDDGWYAAGREAVAVIVAFAERFPAERVREAQRVIGNRQ